ncbi:MAG: iron-containing alcohol dehydrogenase [Deltaproteobacteria bacterium]|nr:iron-containing alcohol dehydrogenase [Deltaproteobacteria bacterium]
METASQLLDRLTADAARSGQPGRTRHIALGEGVIDALPAWLDAQHPGRIDVIVADANTYAAAGKRVEAALEGGGRFTTHLVLDPRPGEDTLTCETGVIEALRTFLVASDRFNAIAVGSGTVSDIVKRACSELERPCQVVPTAASMNGYTSGIVAVLAGGVKRTWPCRQAEAIFADIDVIRHAPAVMNQAGFGDLLSKPYSHADWLLSHLVRGVSYSDEAARLLDEAWRQMIARAEGIGRGEAEATRVLMETILVSGFSMAIAGSSAPASGGEHLISHYWDMEEHCQDRPVRALHGTQVGIGTLVSGRLIERLVGLEASDIDPDAAAARRPDPSWIDAIDADHPLLTPEVIAEVKAQLRDKQLHADALRDELARVRDAWPEIRERLRASLVPPDEVAAALNAAGATSRASAIGVDRPHFERTIRVCRHIRSRYVALDLIDDLGLLERWTPEIVTSMEGPAR